MANDYYEVTTDLDPYTRARSGMVDAEFAAIEAAFDMLPSLAQTQSANETFVAAGGTANAITVAHPITTWASYTGKDSYKLNIQITTTNTSAVTLAVDGLATKACKRNDGAALQAGDLVAGGFYDFIYDETAGYFVVPEAINGVLTDATAQAVAAAASASSASTDASTATTQASSASSSASTATTQASTATTQASNAAASATLASQWASNPEDDDVSGGEFSAKHYSIKAAASAASAGANVAGQINGATAKTPLVDNDEFGIADSAASYGLKKTLWSTIKSGIWTALGTMISGGTSKTTPVDADTLALSDSAASNATKKLTFANLKAKIWADLGALISGGTAKTTPVTADTFALSDSAESNNTKKVTFGNLKTAIGSGITLLSPRMTTTRSATAATGTVNLDVLTQSLLMYTSNATNDWVLNVRGDGTTQLDSIMSTGETLVATFVARQGATAKYLTALNIDGAAQTVGWLNDTAPSAGTANADDWYIFSITKTGSAAYYVTGERKTFG